jgi:hypothetical protein
MAAEVVRLEAHLPAVKPKLMRYPGVLDVYVGVKTVDGLATDVVAFIVDVARKKPLSELAPNERVPSEIDGFSVDVHENVKAVLESEVYCGGFRVAGGTLGVFAVATAANAHLATGAPVMVTNHHVASRIGEAIGVGSVCDCGSSYCCEDAVVVDARRDASVDVAIARLSGGTRFSHEILGIGAIRGSAPPATTMNVVKYGRTTKLTFGRITATNRTLVFDDLTMTNQVRVAPRAPSTDFSEPGDSGSVYVEEATGRVVALHHSGPVNGPEANGSPIPAVLTAMNIAIPVLGTAGSIPLGATGSAPRAPTAMRASVAELERKLRATATGAHWAELVERHAREVRELVNYDRRAKVVWQRVQGPAFLAHWIKSARDPSYRVPVEIGGMHLHNALLAMCVALRERGSRELAAAATEHYLIALELTQRHDRAHELVADVCTRAEAAERE